MRSLLVVYALTLVTTLSGMEILSAVALLAWARHALRTRRVELPLWRPVAAFSLIVALGIALGDASYSQKWADLFRLRFFLFFLAAAWLHRRVSVREWLLPFSIGLILLCAYSTLQHFFPIDWIRPEGRKIILYSDGVSQGSLVIGFFNHHLTFSNVFWLWGAFFLAYGFYRFPKFILCWPLGVWMAILCLWSGSRLAWVAIPITIVVVAIGKSWRWREPLVAFVVTSLALAVLFQFSSDIRARFHHTFDFGHTHQSVTPRLKLWRAQWEFFKESPLYGVGWNNNERRSQAKLDGLYPGEKNTAGHAHSMPLQILATTGALGFLAYMAIWLGLLRRLWPWLSVRYANDERRWIALGCLAAFVGFWVQGVTQWNFGDAEVLHNLMFMWGLAVARSED